jgi:hypothetical protein
LIVDRSIQARSGNVVVAVLNGEFLVRRLQVQEHSISLLPENKKYGSIQVAQLSDYSTWGVVTFVILNSKKCKPLLTAIVFTVPAKDFFSHSYNTVRLLY